MVNEREIVRTNPADLEFYEIAVLLSEVLSTAEKALLKAAKYARNCAAHVKPLSLELVRKLSDHYEVNRDALDSDIPGWNWPRAGQTMIMTVGPSAAGKSTWASRQGIDVVSSDEVRREIPPDGVVTGDQSVVFRHVRSEAGRLLANGRDVIVDATHIREEHRLRQAGIVPPDMSVHYMIIDRPLTAKVRDAGWRAKKGIVEDHHEGFETAVEAALGGDGLPNVKVKDLRVQ
jgi:predicted kinase